MAKVKESPIMATVDNFFEKIKSFGIYGIIIVGILTILYLGFCIFIFLQIKNFNTSYAWLQPILLFVAVLVSVWLFIQPFSLLFHFVRANTSDKKDPTGSNIDSGVGTKTVDKKIKPDDYPELKKIGLKIAMFLVILGIIFVTKLFFKSQGGVKNVLIETFIGTKTREEIVADSLQRIVELELDGEKARSRAEDQLIAEEGGVFGSVAAGLFGKQIFRGKSDSQESEDSEDLTNSVPNNTTGRQNSNTSVTVPDPNIAIEQERMKNLLKNQNTDPQGNPIVPVTYPGSQ